MVITWCKIRHIRWMQKNLPSELPELLALHQRCVGPGVALMEDNSPSVDQRWPLLHECSIQAVQLLAVQVRIERLAIGKQLIVDDSLPIPPSIHPLSKCCFFLYKLQMLKKPIKLIRRCFLGIVILLYSIVLSYKYKSIRDLRDLQLNSNNTYIS